MNRIKKTVTLRPGIDRAVRTLWAAMVRQGLNYSYSDALNHLITYMVCRSTECPEEKLVEKAIEAARVKPQ